MPATSGRRPLLALVAALLIALLAAAWFALRPGDGDAGGTAGAQAVKGDSGTRDLHRARDRVTGGASSPDVHDDGPPPPLPRVSRLDVRVVSEATDAPLAGAEVVFEGAEDDVRTGTTDDAGAVTFDHAPWGDAVVRVSAPGHVPATSGKALPLGGRSDLVVTLRTVREIDVLVRDAWDDTVVAGAVVRALSVPMADLPPDSERGIEEAGRIVGEARTDDAGRARVASGHARLDAAVLRVSGDGLETTWTYVPGGLLREDTAVVIHTARGGTVHGTVRDGAGAPVPRARVCLLWGRSSSLAEVAANVTVYAGERTGGAPRPLWWPLTTRTDDAGRYRFDGVRLGAPFRLVAVTAADDEGPREGPLRLDASTLSLERDLVWPAFGSAGTEHDDDAPPRVALTGPEAVSGIVVDDAGDPVPRAGVSVSGSPHATTTDTRGRFTIRGLPGGDCTLHAVRLGVARASVAARAPADDLRIVLAGYIEPAVRDDDVSRGVAAADGRHVTFTLVVPDGAPPPVYVHAMFLRSGAMVPLAWETDGPRHEVRFDAPERLLAHLASGRADALRLAGAGFRDVSRPVPATDVGDIDLGEIVLDTGLEMRGRVVDDRGDPVAGATVYASSGRGRGAALTGYDGTFRLGGLAPGEAQVTAGSRRHGTATATVEVDADGARDVRLVVQRLAEVRVLVRDDTALPVFDVLISVDGERVLGRATDRTGRISLWLPAGRHVVRAHGAAAGLRDAESAVTPDVGETTELVLTLRSSDAEE